MIIYAAHPINGLSYQEVTDYYSHLIDDLHGFHHIIHPMMGKDYLRTAKELRSVGYEGLPPSTNHAIKERDQWMVKKADIVFVDLTGAKGISIGCVMELAWADLLGKHTVVVLDKEGYHKHAFVLECADVLFDTHDEAIEYLKKIKEE